MKLGILSDTHNEVANTRAALEIFRARGVTRLVHCGDLTRPELVALFAGWDVAFVYGNIDRDRFALAGAVQRTAGPTHIGVTCELALNGWTIGACHGHDEELLDAMIASQAYTLVCHGHTHVRRDLQVGSTRVINPGALGGRHREARSVCVFDLEANTAEFCYV